MDTFSYLIRVAVYLLSFVVCFDAMRCINYEKLLKKGHVAEARILYYLIIAGLSYLVGSFVMQFINI